MRNIFLLIRRYATFLFFLFLQGFCIYLIVHYNKYHNAIFSNTANQLTGKVNTQFSKVQNYLYLKKSNDSLIKANEKLYNLLKENYQYPDTIINSIVDSIIVDSLLQYQRYNYMQATVVANQVNSKNNYIVLGRGQAGNLKIGMGVVDLNRKVIGIITDLSKDFAVVMSLLHSDSHISGKLFKTGETGTISWDGTSPNIVSFVGIPKSAQVQIGDSIITSGFSTTFPKGLLIGTVLQVEPDKTSSNFKIKLKTSANFYNLQYAYVIDNLQKEKIDELLNKIPK